MSPQLRSDAISNQMSPKAATTPNKKVLNVYKINNSAIKIKKPIKRLMTKPLSPAVPYI